MCVYVTNPPRPAGGLWGESRRPPQQPTGNTKREPGRNKSQEHKTSTGRQHREGPPEGTKKGTTPQNAQHNPGPTGDRHATHRKGDRWQHTSPQGKPRTKPGTEGGGGSRAKPTHPQKCRNKRQKGRAPSSGEEQEQGATPNTKRQREHQQIRRPQQQPGRPHGAAQAGED